MPDRPKGEPEYRRRVREKAAKDKEASERERQEAAQDTRLEQIIGSVEKLVEQADRYTDEKTPENKCKKWWERAGVVGLWAAAFVGVAAIIVGSWDANRQTQTTNRLADAATMPYVFAKFQGAASLFGWINGENRFLEINLQITNYGQGPAIIKRVSCSPFWGDENDIDFGQLAAIGNTQASGVAPGQVIAKDPVVANCLGPWPANWTHVGWKSTWGKNEIMSAIVNNPIWLLGRVDYEDISGNPHETLICARYHLTGLGSDADALDVFKAPECNDGVKKH